MSRLPCPAFPGSQWPVMALGGGAPSPDFSLGYSPGLQQPSAEELCILGPVTSGGAAAGCGSSTKSSVQQPRWLTSDRSRIGAALHI